MDYVYGQLCERVKEIQGEYTGIKTDTAEVIINNNARTIAVNAAIPQAPSSDGLYTLTVSVSDGVSTYSWQEIEDS